MLLCYIFHIIVGPDRLHVDRPVLGPSDAAVDPCQADVVDQLYDAGALRFNRLLAQVVEGRTDMFRWKVWEGQELPDEVVHTSFLRVCRGQSQAADLPIHTLGPVEAASLHHGAGEHVTDRLPCR